MKFDFIKNKFFKTGIWNVVGNFFVKGSNLIFSLYFASVMTQAEFGKTSTFMAYATILSVILGLNLCSSLNNAKIEFASDYEGYKSSTLFFSLLSFLAFAVLGLVFMEPLSALLKMSLTSYILLIIYSASLYVLMFFQAANITQFNYKGNLAASAFNIFVGFILALLLIFVFMPDDKVVAKELGITVPLVLLAGFIIIKTFVKGKKFVNTRYWRFAAAIALPNIAHTLAQDILSQSDRIFIQQICGFEDVGVYSLIHYFGLCMNLLWSGINGVWVPWLFGRLAEGNTRSIIKNSRRYLWSFSAITVLMCVVVPPVIKFIMPPEYISGVTIVMPIILAGYFMCVYSFMANLEFYHKKNAYIAIGTLAAALCNIILNSIFINLFGFEAAAYTTLVSYALLFLFHYVVVHFVLKINIYKMREIFLNILLTCTLCAAVSILWMSIL